MAVLLPALNPLGPGPAAHMPDPKWVRPASTSPHPLIPTVSRCGWVFFFLKPPLGWRFVDGKEEKRTLYSTLIRAPGISHLFSPLSFPPSALTVQGSWVGGTSACGVSASPTPNWVEGTQAPVGSPGPGEQCALTSSDLSSSLGLVLRKWKTVFQGVRSSSGLGE